MTSERRIIVSLRDIKLISYECKKCGARVSFSPDAALDAGDFCFQCKQPWRNAMAQVDRVPMAVDMGMARQPTFFRLVQAVANMRNPEIEKTLGFRVLFEFEELPMQSVSQKSAPEP